MAREGILVEPYRRLNNEQIERIHRMSMDILLDPGIICFNKDAAEAFADDGAAMSSRANRRNTVLIRFMK